MRKFAGWFVTLILFSFVLPVFAEDNDTIEKSYLDLREKLFSAKTLEDLTSEMSEASKKVILALEAKKREGYLESFKTFFPKKVSVEKLVKSENSAVLTLKNLGPENAKDLNKIGTATLALEEGKWKWSKEVWKQSEDEAEEEPK